MAEYVIEKTDEKFVQKELKLISGYDKLQLSAIAVEPAKAWYPQAKGVVVLVHGMAEHKERYIPFMKYLAENGYISLIHDHRGHGASVRSEDDLGFLYKKGEDGIVLDVVQMVQYAKAKYHLPVHLFGHSMGSLIVRLFIQKHDTEIDSLTISGCVGPNGAAGIGGKLAAMIGKFKGDHYRSAFLNNMAFGAYNKNIPDAKSVFAWLSVNEDNVKTYEEDPLCGYCFTANGFEALMKMVKGCYDAGRYQAKNINLPILFVSGKDDPCYGGEKGWNSAIDFIKKLGYVDVEGHLLDGMRHEILNETDHEKVYEMILANIEKAYRIKEREK